MQEIQRSMIFPGFREQRIAVSRKQLHISDRSGRVHKPVNSYVLKTRRFIGTKLPEYSLTGVGSEIGIKVQGNKIRRIIQI